MAKLFDLSKKEAFLSEHMVKSDDVELTNPMEEYADMITNHTELSRAKWLELNNGDHIRYTRTDGKFRTGGYVVDLNIMNGELTRLTLSTGEVYNPKRWSINTENIARIWVKKNEEHPAIKVYEEKITSMQREIDELKIKQQNMESFIKKLAMIVQRLQK